MNAQQIEYIKKHRLKQSSISIAKHLQTSVNTVRNYMRKNGLTVSKEVISKFKSESMSNRTTSTPQIDAILKREYIKTPVRKLAKKVSKSPCFVKGRLAKLKLEIPEAVRKERKNNQQFAKGHLPFNKGKKQTDYMSAEAIVKSAKYRYQKGHIPHNTKQQGDGAISIRTDSKTGRKYYFIRIKLDQWEPLHVQIWEKKNGPTPAGHIITFKDGNSLNCIPDNLMLLSRRENMLRNSIKNLHPTLQENIRVITRLKKAINKKEKTI